MPAMNESEWTPDEVIEVGRWQKYLIWLILFHMVSIILFFMLSVTPQYSAVDVLVLFVMIARIVLIVFSLYCIYKMAVSLKKDTAILYAVAMFIPLISLLVLAHLSAEATRILRRNDIKVSVMGADKADLERLCSGYTPTTN